MSGVLKNADVLLAVAVVGIIGVLVIPLPPWVIDFLLAFSITFALAVLLATLYIKHPLELSVFPGMLLIVTLFRLSLNVASTRLILSEAYAGEVISAFGGFVVRGNYVVGFIIFFILVIIQFVVITKGAGRVSEVAARFTLDAMPGKQMAIDADLNAGLISESEAKTRRQSISQEADFYGAMDGASKFVRGDAVAGLIITAVNVIGGLVVGVLQRGMDFGTAAKTYTLLSVGDGLVSQVPALIISVSSGLIVTRAASDTGFGSDLAQQITATPRALAVAAGMLALLGFVPGMPTVPFLFLAGGVGVVAWSRTRAEERERVREDEERIVAPPPKEKPEESLRLDMLEIEIGYGLIPIVDTSAGGDLLDRVATLRRQIASDMGLIMPPVRIRDNVRLSPSQYDIKLKGTTIATGELMMNYLMAINPGTLEEEFEGIPTTEPAFGLQAVWVAPHHKEMAELKGFTVVEPSAVLATHLTEIVKSHAAELLNRQDVQNLLDHFKTDYPSLVDEALAKIGSVGPIQRVLQNLLKERLPIKDMVTVLETMIDYWSVTKDTDVLSEYVRRALRRSITQAYCDDRGVLTVFTFDPAVEKLLSESIGQTASGFQLQLAPDVAERLLNRIGVFVDRLVGQGLTAVVLAAPNLRLLVRRFAEIRYPNLVALSFNDLLPSVQVSSEGSVTLGDDD